MQFDRGGWQGRGFALPTVIFLMVTVALLLGYMSRIAMQQSATADLAVLSARADMAVRSALEWATYQIKRNNACPSTPPTIDQHLISIACTRTPFQEGSASGTDNRFRYDLQVRAESAGGNKTSPDYAYRSLNVTLMVEL